MTYWILLPHIPVWFMMSQRLLDTESKLKQTRQRIKWKNTGCILYSIPIGKTCDAFFFLFLAFFPVWYPSNLQWGFVTPLSIPCSSCVFWGNVGCNCGWFIANDVNVCTLTKWCQDNLFFFPFFQLYACCWLLLLLLPSRKRDTKKLGACVLRNPVWF